MQKLLIVLLFLIFTNSITAFGQRNNFIVHISTETDTFKIGDPLILNIHLKNSSKKTFKIPKNFTYTSVVYPNPIEQIIEGATLHLLIDPIDPFGSIIIENQIFVTETKFQKLKPNDIIELEYNYGQHLNDYLSFLSKDDLVNQNIDLTIEYIFKPKSTEPNVVTGKKKSNTIKLYLKTK